MTRHHVNCIVPPHILQKLLQNPDEETRNIALSTLLATTRLRAERRIVAQFGFTPNIAGTRRRTLYDCRGAFSLRNANLVRSESDPKSADGTVNRAYDGLGTTYDFYKQVLDRNSIDGRGMRLDGFVHYGRNYNNAFWDGRQMVFGDGDGRIFTDFTASLDVVAHELAHGVTEFTANLEYHNQSGALNESISDVFGSLVKQWSLGQTADQADWLIGKEIFSPGIHGDALRSLKSPGSAYSDSRIGQDPQPKHIDQFVRLPDTEEGDWGGVHINSGIPNHAFYLTATFVGGNAWEAPGHIWYESLKASTERTEFQEFADTTSQMAGRLYGTGSTQQQAVRAAWKEVGIRVGVVVRAEDARERRPTGTDGQAVVIAKIDELSDEVRRLAADFAAWKTLGYAGQADRP